MRGGPPAALFAVFDGHGGGQVALHGSRCLGEELQQELDAAGWATEDARRGAAECAFLALDRRIARELGAHGVRSCGSTCVAAATWPEERGIFRTLIANLGDSRALVVRCASGSGGLIFESTDHKPDSPQEMRRIREAGGRITGGAVGDAAGALGGPARVDGGLACARALGDTNMKADPSRPPERQKISALPDVYDLACRPGDVLLLACDGVFDVMTSREAADFISAELPGAGDGGHGEQQLSLAAGALVREALRRGSMDNVTCLVAQLRAPLPGTRV